MKIYLPNTSQQSLGGGWTFRRNLIKGGQGLFEVVDNWKDCDVVLITGATMTNRDEMNEAKSAGKKIVFRIDNMPKDSRNRGTAFSRMADFAKMADYIIFQSEWAKDYVGWWLTNKVEASSMFDYKNRDTIYDGKITNAVIYNGVDTDFFYHTDKPEERIGNVYLYIQYNRDENKRFPEAAYKFYMDSRDDTSKSLWLIGQFSPEIAQYNFDFFNNERVIYQEAIDDPKRMGELMRKAKVLYFPAFADASPQTLHEGLACGLKPECVNNVGGSIEILNRWNSGIRYSIGDMCEDYRLIFEKLLNA